MKTSDNPLEKEIEKKVNKHAESLGILQYKFVSPQKRHVPDRVYFYRGKMWMVEYKRRGEKPTAAQAIEHAKLVKQGVRVFVVDNVASGKSLVEEMVK